MNEFLNDYLNDLYIQHDHIISMWVESICSFDPDVDRLDEWCISIMKEIIKVRKDMGL